MTILESGRTTLLEGEQVDKSDFRAENRNPAPAEPLVLGITQASLSTTSFISAASL